MRDFLKEIQTDYDKVVKVIESCVDVPQVTMVRRLIGNFAQKWKFYIDKNDDKYFHRHMHKLTIMFDALHDMCNEKNKILTNNK